MCDALGFSTILNTLLLPRWMWSFNGRHTRLCTIYINAVRNHTAHNLTLYIWFILYSISKRYQWTHQHHYRFRAPSHQSHVVDEENGYSGGWKGDICAALSGQTLCIRAISCAEFLKHPQRIMALVLFASVWKVHFLRSCSLAGTCERLILCQRMRGIWFGGRSLR